MDKINRLARSAPSLLASLFALSLGGLSGCGELEVGGEGSESRGEQLTFETVPLALAPLEFKGLLFWDAASSLWRTVAKVDGRFTWPTPYDLDPTNIHFTFAPQGDFTSQDVEKLVARNGFAREVYLNDVKLTEASGGVENDYYVSLVPGPNADYGCPAGVKCIDVTVKGARAKAAAFQWDLRLAFWKTPGVATPNGGVHGYVQGPSSPKSYFADKVAPIFQHDNCSTCHKLGSKDKLVAHHHGFLSSGTIYETSTPRGTQLRCGGGCHNFVVQHAVPGKTFGETEWMAPASDMGIDWTGKTSQEICARVKQNLPTQSAMKKHFFDDARIAWAVHSGKLPPNADGPESKAPPFDYYEFVKLMTAWIEGGQKCP